MSLAPKPDESNQLLPHPPTPQGYSQQPPASGPPQAIIIQPPGDRQHQTIITQPTGDGRPQPEGMNALQPPPNCPPGLEYLALIDQVLVHQQIEILEVLSGYETNNKYEIKNSIGQRVYFAAEESDWLTRQCCGSARPFDMKIFDNFQNEVIHLYRPLTCASCCCPCWFQNLEVSAPPGNVVGSVHQEWNFLHPIFAVRDASGETMMRIEGPCCGLSCCADVDFKLTSADGSEELGKITKQWGGFVREAATDADNFGITFPMNLDVRMKAVLLGACFLIDFTFFERSNK